MATLVLAAAGAALGGAAGGAVLGVGAATIGQAAGAIVGGLIDQKVLGSGSEAVARGKASTLRIQTSQEGAPIPRVQGRMRVAGQVIWSTRFKEHVARRGGGKGGGPTVSEYSYTISFAVALCEGPIERIGRVWADGKPLDMEAISWRLHKGDESQGPDPLIEAVEGEAPAYRGVAYLVFEDLPVGSFGNRMPQINVEVFRQPRPGAVPTGEDGLPLREVVRAVAMSPGTGEFVYDTIPVREIRDEGDERYVNVNTSSGKADALVSLDQLETELPACRSVSLVVSWFGTDLRAEQCELRPGVENAEAETAPEPWSAGGTDRAGAHLIGRDEQGRPVFGGTPSDASVVRFIREMKARGLRVMFYPFILMDIPAGNGLTDPWNPSQEQPAYPWRGRITTNRAPDVPGTTDMTPFAEVEAQAFFGDAEPEDFELSGDQVIYSGPDEWRMRRFILHYAHLCKAAGGVDAFCIGSELRSLTQIRSGRESYPAVEELRRLARDVRAVLGPQTKIGYAADWSEYFGHQPSNGDRIFHLDPLWADEAIDFVGVDYYMPLTDWRDGEDHLDAREARSIYDLDYLSSRFAAGEGYEWYYASEADRDAQIRTPIVDGAHGEDWIWRPKDLLSWWSKAHRNRVDGVRSAARTPWRPRMKPIWLTEIGCPAVDKGTNQPNVFVDPKSSENALPRYSKGTRDDLIQRRMLQAAARHWSDPANNPVSDVYGGPMLDLDNVYVWTWDARPWPEFPSRSDIWSDGANHELGHWLDGRTAGASLAEVVAEICDRAGVTEADASELHAIVDGFVQERTASAREALQSLMLAYAFDAYETGGRLRFVMRGGAPRAELASGDLVEDPSGGAPFELVRAPEGEALRDVRIGYLRGDADYLAGAEEIRSPESGALGVQGSELPLALTRATARRIAERWALETAAGRETARFSLPPSRLALEPGDVVRLLDAGGAEYRIERIADGVARRIEATRVDGALYALGARPVSSDPGAPLPGSDAPTPPAFRLLDVPFARFGGSETEAYLAAWSANWPGSVSIYASDRDEGYAFAARLRRPSTVARLVDPLPASQPWRWSRGARVRVKMLSGELLSADELAVFNGANLAALAAADGQWELLQFREAALVGPGEYELSGFLRGLGGTEALIGDPAPAGAVLVMLGEQLAAFEAPRGLERHYRIGPSGRDLNDDSFQHAVWTHQATGLRPWAPAHLRAELTAGGDVALSWVRRSRRDIDAWSDGETPLDEAFERYRVRVYAPDGAVAREVEADGPGFVYDVAMQAADGFGGGLAGVSFGVAQISEAFGPGIEGKATLSG
ncbi:baseplate multidomain protein megatron [Oceanicella actignis]|uniref:baseplate multidomain protein megatron n=1 Tax=Oceanicella actignis TaxID=1189325 RepID=UPI0011E7F8F4|nr:glycoside hydrolase/phage tail family protein [Oceanicella actignis]TYO85040.1 putative tail protein [Oceanicella actignis]